MNQLVETYFRFTSPQSGTHQDISAILQMFCEFSFDWMLFNLFEMLLKSESKVLKLWAEHGGVKNNENHQEDYMNPSGNVRGMYNL